MENINLIILTIFLSNSYLRVFRPHSIKRVLLKLQLPLHLLLIPAILSLRGRIEHSAHCSNVRRASVVNTCCSPDYTSYSVAFKYAQGLRSQHFVPFDFLPNGQD